MAASVGEVHCGIAQPHTQNGTVFVSASTGKLPVLNSIVPVPARYGSTVYAGIKPVPCRYRDVCWVVLRMRLEFT